MENQQQPQTTLCKSGCGFFGTASNEGFCSKCYKDAITRQQDTARISPTIPVPVVMAASPSSSTSPSSLGASSSPASSSDNSGGSSSSSCNLATAVGSSVLSSSNTSSLAEKPMTCSQAALSAEDQVAKLESAAATAQVTLSSSSSAVCLESAVPSPTPVDLGPPAKKVNRCGQCKKKVGLTGFECRCGGLFCSEHRYDTAHSCQFDYKTMEREQIAKNNPVCVSDKIRRI